MVLAEQNSASSLSKAAGALLENSAVKATASKRAASKWARAVIAQLQDRQPLELVIEVATGIRSGLSSRPGDTTGEFPDLAGLERPTGGWANPWLLGLLHEYAVSEKNRKSRGAWYTPETVVRGLVTLAIPNGAAPLTVVDPTCGGGAFLLAALDRLVELGLSPEQALDRVKGLDIDEDAVAVSRLSIQLWALKNQVNRATDQIPVEVGDALDGFPARWENPMIVVGNPPFASPLRKGAIPENAERFRADRSDMLQPYADLAAIHLLSAIEKAGSGSTVVLVQPQSVLASQDTRALRAAIAKGSTLESLWVAREAVFDAGVRVCAPVIRVGGTSSATVELLTGPTVGQAGSTEVVSWASCAARALGSPSLPSECWSAPEVLGSLVSATAGFRDEYYGLVAACFELPVGAFDSGSQTLDRLLTVGAVEPLAPLWGLRPTRLGGRDWQRPAVDRTKLDGKVLRWVERQAKPKVVLATQSKVLEPVIDFDGSFVPVTPLIAVHASEDDLALISAVFLAPPVVAWAWERWFGSAMAVDALKLAAKQVLELPLPVDRKKWEKAASVIVAEANANQTVEQGQAVATEVAALMVEAYRCDRHVFEWWLQRIG